MKKLRSLILVFSIVLICTLHFSCSKFLEEKVYSFSSLESLYTPEGIELALTGVYDIINATSVQGTGNQSLWGGRLPWVLMLGDEVVGNFSKLTGDQLNIASGALSTENTYISDAWFFLFAGINRANNVINNISQIDIAEDRKKEIIGEARFLRGFYRLNLVWMFGAVPMPEGIDDNPYAERESLSVVYQKIEEDLLFAYQNLNHRNNKTGRVNKWTAAAFLLKTYTYLASCKENNVGGNLNFSLNSFEWVNATAYYEKAEIIGRDLFANSQYRLLEEYRYNFL